jgi:hypothetical protein
MDMLSMETALTPHPHGPGIIVEHASGQSQSDKDEIYRIDSGQELPHVEGSVYARTQFDVPVQGAFGQDPEGQLRSDYKDLDTLLRRCGIEYFDKRRTMKCFWPAPLLQRIMTKHRVVEELEAYKNTEPGLFHGAALGVLADTILRHYRKVFAVLVLISKGRFIQVAMDEGLDDTRLPLEMYGTTCQLYKTQKGTSQLKLVECFEGLGWDTCHRECFSEYQYAVDPCVLTLENDGRTPRHKDYHDKVVLPFTDEAERQTGGYGIVTKVTVHEGCHEFHALLKSVSSSSCANRVRLLMLPAYQNREQLRQEAIDK